MTKLFALAVVLGIVALGVFAYFIFGLNTKPSDTADRAENTTPSTVTPLPTQDQNETSQSGLKREDIAVGTGQEVKNGDTVVINYIGTLPDGTKFDSSYDRNQPFETQIGVGQVIKGWDLGVVGMKVGGKRKLTIPPSLGYGAQAAGK